MLAPTHIIAGQAAYLVVCLATNHAPVLWEAWLAAAAALLPDLDKRQSVVGRLFPWISEPLDFHVGHRTLMHSLLFCVGLALVLRPLLPPGVWLAIVVGYASHPILDMMTPAGVGWLWPGRWRCVLPGNEQFRMQTMGWGELVFALVLLVVTVPLVQLAQAKPGTGSVIAAAIGDINTARQRYDGEKGAHRWTLRVEGRDNLSHADISGEYAVIGPWQTNGFLLRTDAGPKTICRGAGCDWYADSGVTVKGAEQLTTTRQVVVEHTSVEALRVALEPLSAVGEVLLIGSMDAPGVPSQAPSVTATGGVVSLRYADLSALEKWQARALRNVVMTVQVRHAEGVEVPNIAIRQEVGSVIPSELRSWIR